jgi:hypothetical protein
MEPHNKTLFTTLLQQSELFDAKAKQVLQVALDTDVLPQPDFDHLLLTLKMEQNLMAVIDQRAKKI